MGISNSPLNPPFPFMNSEQEQPSVTRYLPLPTAQTLKETSLFGIPLKSALTGQTISDNTLNDYIIKAISRLEHELNIFITPVAFEERHDYDREIWTQQYAWIKLNNSPILNCQSVQLSFGNGTPLPPLVEFPLEFVYVNGQEGAIRLVPVLGTATSGFVLSSFSGAQFMALMAMGVFNFPGAVLVKYRAGFEPDKVPAMMSGLIEKMAALMALSALGHLIFPYSSIGIGLDGTSQSVGTPGIQFLTGRIADLKEQVQQELDAARNYYQKKLLIDFF
jgi:hypothetical protein